MSGLLPTACLTEWCSTSARRRLNDPQLVPVKAIIGPTFPLPIILKRESACGTHRSSGDQRKTRDKEESADERNPRKRECNTRFM